MSIFNKQTKPDFDAWGEKPSLAEFNYAAGKYKIARSELLGVIAFTLVNVLMAAVNSGTYFLFSATIPYYVTLYGAVFADVYSDETYVIYGVLAALVATFPYALCWFMAKKNYKWIWGALCYFALDCLGLLYVVYVDIGYITSYIMDIAFHGLALYYLILGTKYGKILQNKYDFTVPMTLEMQTDAVMVNPNDGDNNSDDGNDENNNVDA